MTTENDKYKELSRYLELLNIVVWVLLVVNGVFGIYVWKTVVGDFVARKEVINTFLFGFGWPCFFGGFLVLARLVAMASIQLMLAVKDTAENTAKLVELMSPDDQRSLKGEKTEPPAPR